MAVLTQATAKAGRLPEGCLQNQHALGSRHASIHLVLHSNGRLTAVKPSRTGLPWSRKEKSRCWHTPQASRLL